MEGRSGLAARTKGRPLSSPSGKGGQTLFPRIHRRPFGPSPLPTQSSLITEIDRSLSPLHLASFFYFFFLFLWSSPFLSTSCVARERRVDLSRRESAKSPRKRVPPLRPTRGHYRPARINALFTPLFHNDVREGTTSGRVTPSSQASRCYPGFRASRLRGEVRNETKRNGTRFTNV